MTFKVCTHCSVEKSFTEFYKNKQSSDGVLTICKPCSNKKRKQAWNKEKKLHVNQYAYNRRLERKLWAIEYLGGCCSKCDIKYPHYVYDFHHIDPTTKETGIANLLLLTFEKLKIELDKCNLLCANCHREEHWGDL